MGGLFIGNANLFEIRFNIKLFIKYLYLNIIKNLIYQLKPTVKISVEPYIYSIKRLLLIFEYIVVFLVFLDSQKSKTLFLFSSKTKMLSSGHFIIKLVLLNMTTKFLIKQSIEIIFNKKNL